MTASANITTLLLHWLAQGVGWSPAKAKAVIDCYVRNSGSLRPLGHGKRQAAGGEFYRLSAVANLLSRSRPAAVLRAVIAVVVNAVDRVLGTWLRPHVGKEVLKRFQPSLADCDASTAVAGEFVVVSAVASAIDRLPARMLRSPSHAVSAFALTCPLCLPASARLGVPTAEMCAEYSRFFSALTKADPSRFSVFAVLPTTQHIQPPKVLAREIDKNPSQASARLGVPVAKTGRGGNRLLPAVAATTPANLTVSCVLRSLKNNESGETLAGQIDKGSHKKPSYKEPYKRSAGRTV